MERPRDSGFYPYWFFLKTNVVGKKKINMILSTFELNLVM